MLRTLRNKMSTASQPALAYQQINGRQQDLLPDAPSNYTTGPQHDRESDPPSYESVASRPARASLAHRLANMFKPSSKKPKTPKPVNPTHEATLNRIALAEAEINLSQELEAATRRLPHASSYGTFDQHAEELYSRLVTLIGADIGPQMCLPGTPRAELIGQKLVHLRVLEALQRDVHNCAVGIKICQRASLCPRYTGMTSTTALKRTGELTRLHGAITSEITDVKANLAHIDYLMAEMICEYNELGA
ncbi:hypothetical protein F4803DRAFT_557337 [Xylaria telfairii]|nr:hypothetical protein F4803DRAFT_557337 [Xylaria telfairii]